MHDRLRLATLLVLCLSGLSACTGQVGPLPGASETGETEGPVQTSSGSTLAQNGLSRMSALEYDRSIRILLGDASSPARELLPEDARTPFDNDYEVQNASQALIEGAEFLAQEVTRRFMEDPERRDRVVGCTPTGPDDAECMRSFVGPFLRRAFRREILERDFAFFLDGGGEWAGAMGTAELFNDFYQGVRSVIEIALQDPEFLYRVEVGTPYEGSEQIHLLSGYEVATRLSFFLWGSIPDDALLDRAATDDLNAPEVRMEAALRLLEDPRSQARLAHFHAMWLGYEKLYTSSDLSQAMRTETRALFDRVLFEEQGAWQDIFRFEETFVSQPLAENYGLEVPDAETAWVPYRMDARRGLFAHGSFLALGLKGNDTSPTMRGVAIQRNAFCQEILPPPPGVDVDEPPNSDALCKEQRYAAHASGGCAGCHDSFDPVGFGLENFDAMGAFRTFETDAGSDVLKCPGSRGSRD